MRQTVQKKSRKLFVDTHVSFYRPKDGKEDLGAHAYTIPGTKFVIIRVYYKKKGKVSYEIEDFAETHLCKLRGILRSRVLLIAVLCDLINDV